VQVKGTAVLTIPLFVRGRFGPGGYQKWLQSLSEAVRISFCAGIPEHAWFPLDSGVVEPTVKLCELFYDGGLEGAIHLGQFSAEHGLQGVYRLFVTQVSPAFLVSRATAILPTYYQPCTIEVADRSANSATVRITKFDTPHPVVEHRIKGWMARALEVSGARRPEVHITESMTNGSPVTTFIASWT